MPWWPSWSRPSPTLQPWKQTCRRRQSRLLLPFWAVSCGVQGQAAPVSRGLHAQGLGRQLASSSRRCFLWATLLLPAWWD